MAAKRAPKRIASDELVERERLIRACREPNCVDGFTIRTTEELQNVTATDLDGKVTHQRLVRTQFASRCESCNPEPTPKAEKVDPARVEAAQRSAGA